MSKSLSVLKRARQNEKRKQRNQIYKNNIRKTKKAIRKLMESGASADEVKNAYREYTSAVDKAAKKNVIHDNNAARKKSRMNVVVKKFILGQEK